VTRKKSTGQKKKAGAFPELKGQVGTKKRLKGKREKLKKKTMSFKVRDWEKILESPRHLKKKRKEENPRRSQQSNRGRKPILKKAKENNHDQGVNDF